MDLRKPAASTKSASPKVGPRLIAPLAIAMYAAVGAGAAAAEGSILPFGEIGRIAASEAPSFRIETKNDSVGLFSRKDWDDFRSFGIYGGASLRNWTIELTADGLTNRSQDEATRGRIDELHASVVRRIRSFDEGIWSASLDAGAGAISLGQFGMEKVQRTFHTIYGNFRPIPENHDRPKHALTLLGEGIARVRRKSDFAPLDLSASLEIGHTGFFRTGAYADATLRNGFLGTDIFAGMEWAAGYDSQGPSYENTLDSEKGCIAGANFRIGILEAGYAYNISTERNAARFSVSFGGDRRTEDAGSLIDAIEIGAKPFLGAIRLRKNLPAAGPVTPSIVIGGDSDYLSVRGQSILDTEIYQFEQAFAGLDAAASLAPWLDIYGMCAGGARKERHRTRTIAESTLLDEKNGPVLVAEGGMRVRIPCLSGNVGAWGLCVAGGADFSDALDPGIHPYFQIRLLGENPGRLR